MQMRQSLDIVAALAETMRLLEAATLYSRRVVISILVISRFSSFREMYSRVLHAHHTYVLHNIVITRDNMVHKGGAKPYIQRRGHRASRGDRG